MRINYVLIDFESVQPDALAVLNQDQFKIIVFVGASQAKVPFEAAAALQRMGSKAEYIKISGNGPNALDFHIAYYIGQLAVHDPSAYFHIISKDKGFDPLIQHLKTKKLFAGRSEDISDIPLVRTTSSKTPKEKLDVIVTKLQQLAASKPRTVKTLSSTISSLFQKQLDSDEIAELVKGLEQQGLIAVTATKVSYMLAQST